MIWAGQCRVPFHDTDAVAVLLAAEPAIVKAQTVDRMGPARIEFWVEAPTSAAALASVRWSLHEIARDTAVDIDIAKAWVHHEPLSADEAAQLRS